MKKQTGIWIDSSKAIIVTLPEGKEIINEIKSDIENQIYHESHGDKGSYMESQHISNEKKLKSVKKHQVGSFLENVVEQIKQDDELFVFGPAEIKLKLKTLI